MALVADEKSEVGQSPLPISYFPLSPSDLLCILLCSVKGVRGSTGHPFWRLRLKPSSPSFIWVRTSHLAKPQFSYLQNKDTNTNLRRYRRRLTVMYVKEFWNKTRINVIVNSSLRNGNQTLRNTETLYILKPAKYNGKWWSFYFGQLFLTDCACQSVSQMILCRRLLGLLPTGSHIKPNLFWSPVTHSCQAGPRWNFIRDVLSVDMTNSGTWDIKHFSSTHPNLKRGNLKV